MGYYNNKSDFDLKDLKTLKDVYNDLCRTVDKLYTVTANTKNDEMFLKLNKITSKVLQAKYELRSWLMMFWNHWRKQYDL